ncbi:MAG: cupin domain-containing protein [Acidobacteriota bacterium]|nr:cupin domain-containing protein [Acidobacteriota bacterium]
MQDKLQEHAATVAVSRRRFLEVTGAALAVVAAAAPIAGQQQGRQASGPNHPPPYDKQTGPDNQALAAENPSSVLGVETDSGTVNPFKYSFSLARKRVEKGGWTRQVTQRELPISKTMAGVEMRLTAGGVRELHWHTSAEWAYMIYGNARITAVDTEGRSFVNDVGEGDLWLFPGGIPHSIQGLGPDGCRFLLVFNDGSFNEFETFLLTDWFHHMPKEVLAKNFGVPESTFDNIPPKELFIFQAELPRPLAEERRQSAAGSGSIDDEFVFRQSQMKPTQTTAGGEVRIVDKKLFPATDIAAAIVRVKPGGLRELHWHPLSDEWQYYVSGQGRMTVFEAGAKSRTFDFQAGDVGYIEMSRPHYIENTGSEDLVFLEVFPVATYKDISATEWLAHTPFRLTNEHLKTGEDFLRNLPRTEAIVVPL